LDATSGPAPGDPYWAPPLERTLLAEVGADPGRLRIGFSRLTPDGSTGHPECLEALDDAVDLCAALGHDVVETDLPGLTPGIAAAIGSVYDAATHWIVRYWIRRLGREPEAHEIEPVTLEYWQSGEHTSGADYLEAIEDLQRFARGIAHFLTGIDVWLTPTMSTPPILVGSTPEDGAASVRFPAV